MTHHIVATKPWCGDCGKTRTDQYCTDCCYPIRAGCTENHAEQEGGR